jgi:hypothetical protein
VLAYGGCCCAKDLHTATTIRGYVKFLAASCASVAFTAVLRGLTVSFVVNQIQDDGAWVDRSKEEIGAASFGARTFSVAFGTASEVLRVCAMVVNLMVVVFAYLLAFKR